MGKKTYTLIPMEKYKRQESIQMADKKAALVALAFCETGSCVRVEGCSKGEVSAYTNNRGKVEVYMVEGGDPALNLYLFHGPGAVVEEVAPNGVTVTIPGELMWSTIQRGLKAIDNAMEVLHG